MSLRVARIPYLNSVPFYLRLEGPGVSLVDLPPRALGSAARQGTVDAGIMSMCDVFRTDAFVPLGAMGVAVDGPAHSVLLLSHVPVAELGGCTIGVTSETSTSFPLCRLLLEQRYGVHAAVFARRPRGPRADDAAMLLIGDAALRAAARAGVQPGTVDYAQTPMRLVHVDARQPYRWVLDLAAAWKQWQGLPFVFARWMVRRGVGAQARQDLLDRLSCSLDDALRDLGPVSAEHAEAAGLTPAAAYAYLMGFTYRLGRAEQQAIERFQRLLEGSPWWEPVGPSWLAEHGA